MYLKISSLQAEWIVSRVCLVSRIPLGGLTKQATSILVCGGNLPVQEKCELKQAHLVRRRLRWIYGRGVSGVAEELPSLTAQNGKSFGLKV